MDELNKINILPVIMAGGVGSRLWPLSRMLYPKQFLSLVNDNPATMLQETILRLKGIEYSAPFIICNEEHRFIVAEQIRGAKLEYGKIILEPTGRNTAPAITLAALKAIEGGDDPILLILPADHTINDNISFTQVIEDSISLALSDKLVTFGIVVDKPEIGYGYIKRGDSIGLNAFKVDSFVEKPNLETAMNYLASGEYYWNSGMFLFKASVYLKEIEKFQPEILKHCNLALNKEKTDLDFTYIDKSLFEQCPDNSIDYAIMEKTNKAVVIPLDVDWSDVGSWSALWDINKKDNDGNVIIGDVISTNCQNNYIFSQNKLIATIGIDNLIIVETKDAVLISSKDSVQDIKLIVKRLKELNRKEYFVHREVYRPWGIQDTLVDGERFSVKRVTMNSGKRTITQKHYHRSEHWIVVSGTAKVYIDGKYSLITENESIYIPLGKEHYFENVGKLPLDIIEVLTGSYLDEDDIICTS